MVHLDHRQMPKCRKKKRSPQRILALPDLEQSKTAVLNSITSTSGQRSYDHAIADFVEWYCSEPRLAFNRTVVLRYRIYLEQKQYAPTTINLRLAAVRRVALGRIGLARLQCMSYSDSAENITQANRGPPVVTRTRADRSTRPPPSGGCRP